MSDVNFDKYPSCLLWQVLVKKRGRMDERKKGIGVINYNKVNNNFFLSVSKVCASLIWSGGICPGGICPRGYMS